MTELEDQWADIDEAEDSEVELMSGDIVSAAVLSKVEIAAAKASEKVRVKAMEKAIKEEKKRQEKEAKQAAREREKEAKQAAREEEKLKKREEKEREKEEKKAEREAAKLAEKGLPRPVGERQQHKEETPDDAREAAKLLHKILAFQKIYPQFVNYKVTEKTPLEKLVRYYHTMVAELNSTGSMEIAFTAFLGTVYTAETMIDGNPYFAGMTGITPKVKGTTKLLQTAKYRDSVQRDVLQFIIEMGMDQVGSGTRLLGLIAGAMKEAHTLNTSGLNATEEAEARIALEYEDEEEEK